MGWRRPEGGEMIDLRGKLVLALGERDGIPAQALTVCVERAGGRVVYAATQCFV
jgi:glycine reductase